MSLEEISGPYLQHIIDASHRKSFDAYKEIDWNVPFDYSYFYMPQDMISLFGTKLWDQMTREQKVKLSMHEACSAFAGLIWFENQLSFKLMDYLIDESPLDLQFYWMQIEVADECRHSMMFGEAIRRSGVPWYKPRYSSLIAFFTKYLTSRVGMMLSTLAAEEITGYLHHRTEKDPECHPVMRELSRIHILEEARHRGYAHQYLRQKLAACRNVPALDDPTLRIARDHDYNPAIGASRHLREPRLADGSAGDGEAQSESLPNPARDDGASGRVPDRHGYRR